MTTTLDTSGYVQCHAPDQKPNETTGCWVWSDLSPFTQGYIEALLKGLWEARWSALQFSGHIDSYPYGFSDLAPETLARIIADCGKFSTYLQELYSPLRYGRTNTDGRSFWTSRQRGERKDFPPLTVQLGDDGKVRFSERG